MKYDEFKMPGAAWRGKPFWSWNGKLEESQLMTQIAVFDKMGMGGYFCHSRTGLQTQYLGEEWFTLISACADEGRRRGLETWLYDEDRWPSGTAAGLVTAEPRFRLKFLRMTVLDAGQYTPPADRIAAFSVKLKGQTVSNVRRLDNEIPADGTVLCFTIEEMEKDSVYNGYTYADTMNREATEHFIDLTHRQYRKRTGDRLGDSIYGIFTDEPHRGALMNNFSIKNPSPGYLVPWTYDLFDQFQQRFGYSLVDNLPELYYFKEGQAFSQVKYHTVLLLEQLFLERYMKPIHDWCRENGLQLTGHLLHEDSLTAQTCMMGSILRAYEYMDIPGVDVLTEHNSCHWLAKQAVSVARQLGHTRILSELYGCTGWQMTFANHKAVGDWQALMGINLRCHHLSWYTMEGEAKRDYPASILHQSDWHRYYRYVEDYFARLHVFLSHGEPVCDLLVLYPVESLWGRIYPDWAHFLEPQDKIIQALEQRYRDTFRLLCGAHIDFDYGDEDLIARFGRVENGCFCIGRARYRAVLATGMLTIRSSTARLLEEFRRAGGTVVFAGELPEYVDALASSRVKASFADCQTAFSREAILHSLALEPPVAVLDPETRMPDENIYLQMRRSGDEECICLINMDREHGREVLIDCGRDGFLEKWDPRTGRVSTLAVGQKLSVPVTFPPAGELLLVITPKNNGYGSEPVQQKKITMPMGLQAFSYHLTEPNVCVLDRARCVIAGGEELPEMDILRVDILLRNRYGLELRGGDMLQPWCQKNKVKRLYDEIAVHFDFYVECRPEAIMLAVETPEQFSMDINGHPIVTRCPGQWVDGCFHLFRIDSVHLRLGHNTITLKTRFNQGSNLEAIYLLGDFGVRLAGTKATLTALPERIAPGDLTAQGFPFYGAGVIYQLPPVPACIAGERLVLAIDGLDAACVVARCEEEEKVIAFPPYTADITEWQGTPIELEYVLTRRNTFGPLHQYPLTPASCAPTNFYTQGEHYLENSYGLIPQGMTGQVTVRVYMTECGHENMEQTADLQQLVSI